MKQVEVSAAVIFKGSEVLVTTRGYGENKGMAEFPGGKLEPNETPETCLKREIKEELNAEINIISHLKTIVYDYPKFRLKMHVFMCELIDDKFELLEGQEAKYVNKDDLKNVNFLAADFTLLPLICRFLEERQRDYKIQ